LSMGVEGGKAGHPVWKSERGRTGTMERNLD
jgi:hypothetical protein